MSFYTSLTGLNSATAQLAVTSNNIANVGTSGFKRSRADFGDIFSTSPLQKSSSNIGQGVSLKQVSQEFSQGNISTSGNSLDLAITGDGFFPLKSPDGLQDIYTRNGAFMLNDQNNVVNSTGQRLQAASVDSSGKADLSNLSALTVPPKTSGEAQETRNIQLGLNLPADSSVITATFDRANPNTYNKSTALTVYDSGGNGYLATVYYVKTQNASATAPESKWQTYFYVGDTLVKPELLQATDKTGNKLYVNKYGTLASTADVNADGSKVVTPPSGKTEMYTLDELEDKRFALPAELAFTPQSGTIGSDGKYTTSQTGKTLAFTLNVDGQSSGQVISYTMKDVDNDPIVLARNLEAKINNQMGKLSTLTDRRFGIGVSYSNGIFKLTSGSTGDSSTIAISSYTDTSTNPANTDAWTQASATLGLTANSISKSTVALRGETSKPATLYSGTISGNTASEMVVDNSNNKFYVSVDGIGANITLKTGSYTMKDLATEIQNAINGDNSLKDNTTYAGIVNSDSGRKVLGVKVEFDATSKRLVFQTATTGDESSIQVSGDADWGLDKTDIQFGATTSWIKLSQHYENGAPQYIRNGEQTQDSTDVSASTEWWPVYLDRGELSFALDGKPVSPVGPMPYATAFLDGGKGALTLTIDFTQSTQYSSAFAVLSQSQDGAPEGDLMGLDIGVDGLVNATYSNGSQVSLGKIVLANFSSPTGLRQIGDASYLSSATSGVAKIGEAGSAGFGSIRAGATERANVDLTQELVDLITAQRNFQANAKAIETSSTMTQAIVNLRT